MRSEHFEALRTYIGNIDRLHSVMSKIVVLLFSIKPLVLTHALIRTKQSYTYAIGQTVVYAMIMLTLCMIVWTVLLHVYRHDKYVTPEMLVQVIVKQLHATTGSDERRLHNTLLIYQQWRSLSPSPSAYLRRMERIEVNSWKLVLITILLSTLFQTTDTPVLFGSHQTSWDQYLVISGIYVVAMRITWITTVLSTRTLREAWEIESNESILYTPPYQILEGASSTSRIEHVWVRICSDGSVLIFFERPVTAHATGGRKKGHLRIVRSDAEPR